MKSAYIFFADGFEDIEAIAPVDILRRAEVDALTVGVTGQTVTSSHSVKVSCDRLLSDIASGPLPDLAILPGGGKGSRNLAASVELRKFITRMIKEDRLVGAICAAPAVVLGAWDLLGSHRWTCYPGMGDGLRTKPLEDRVVVDGHLVTSRAAGTAEEFSLALVSLLCGADVAGKVGLDILAGKR